MWELCVIGTAIKSPASISEAQDLLPSDFTGENQRVWAEILSLSTRGMMDLSALSASLLEKRVFGNETNLAAFLQDALNYAGTAMKEYVDHVLENSTKRSILKSAALIAAEAQEENKSASELIGFMEGELVRLRRNRTEGLSISDIVATFMPRLQEAREGKFAPAWSPRLLAVKEVFPFAENSDFMVIAARPGDGKSSYLRYEALSQAKNGKGVLIINLENDPLEYARNFIALETGINTKKLRTGNLTDDEMETVKATAHALSSMPIYIEFAPTADLIVAKIRRYLSEKKISSVYVDYIQLVSNGIQKKVEDVSYTTRALRLAALNMGIPVIAASQLNRDIERRGVADQEPQLADLRDSGSLEQDATSVIFIQPVWRDPTLEQVRIFPENIENGVPTPRLQAIPVQFHVKKNRNGETGRSSYVKWHKATGRFFTLERGARV